MDPYELASEYFNTLVRNGKGKKNLAIFIDDLDRCKPEYAVKLLEGIQTLFKSKSIRIFYLVSADKSWLKNCFENEYKEQRNLKKNESIGYHFLEKIFQISTRLPNSNKKSEESLIDKLLGLNIEDKVPTTQSGVRDDNNTIAVAKVVSNSTSTEEKSNIETSHLLTKYHHYIGSNPRTLKRILNSYEINRHLIALELGKKILEEIELEIIMKCTILEQRWPDVMTAIEQKIKAVKNFKEGRITELKQLNINEKLLKELEDDKIFNQLLSENPDFSLYFGIGYKNNIESFYE